MADQEEIRFGILGCGLAAGFHADAVRSVGGAVLAGVYDADPERSAAFAAERGCRAFESFSAFAGSGDIDAVCVCTPSGLHAPNAVSLLEQGKHLLIEKPVAVDEEGAKAILASAERSGKTVGVVSQLRCCPDVRRLKDAIAAGELGDIVSVQLGMLYHRTETYYGTSPWHGTLAMDGGGALINQGIHGVDLLLWLLGRVKRVQSVKATLLHDIEAEDTLCALLEFESGCIGTLNAATSVWPGQPRTLCVCGAKGSAVLTEDRLTEFTVRGGAVHTGCAEATAYLSHSDPGAIPPEAHENVIRDFCAALNEGRRPVSDAVDGCNALSLIRAIYRSAESGSAETPDFIAEEGHI